MIRYSIIKDKNPREILLIRGTGCKWKKCTFCDYHTDFSKDEEENLQIFRREAKKVTGSYHHLEIINSGSFPELGENILSEIIELCRQKEITTLHMESHWLYRKHMPYWKERFKDVGTELKVKIGVESFEYDYREEFLKKGINEKDPKVISENFDECCLLFGLKGQTEESMRNDILTALENFERVCVNIFVKNTSLSEPDKDVIEIFTDKIMPEYINNERVDILLQNTDFGVGAEGEDE